MKEFAYPITIYALVSTAEPKRFRYVGQTWQFRNRIGMHLHQRRNCSPVARWIRDSRPVVLAVRLELCHDRHADDREAFWIGELKQRGMADLNVRLHKRTTRYPGCYDRPAPHWIEYLRLREELWRDEIAAQEPRKARTRQRVRRAS